MLKFFKQKNTKVKGFTLVEVLVALFIFSISILAIMAVLSKGISDISVVKKKITAEYLAQEGIELIRNIRDSSIIGNPSGGWTTFMAGMASCSDAGSPCYIDNDNLGSLNITQCSNGSCPSLSYDSSSGRYSSVSGTASGFTREVWGDDTAGPGEIEIFSKVSWNTGSGNHSIIFSESLFNWVPPQP